MITKIKKQVLVSFDDLIAHDLEGFNDLIEGKIDAGILSDIDYEFVELGAVKNTVWIRVTAEADDMEDETDE